MSRATLNDLVEDILRLQLEYGDGEFTVNNDEGILYDADETENLSKKLSELGKSLLRNGGCMCLIGVQVSNMTVFSQSSMMMRKAHVST